MPVGLESGEESVRRFFYFLRPYDPCSFLIMLTREGSIGEWIFVMHFIVPIFPVVISIIVSPSLRASDEDRSKD